MIIFWILAFYFILTLILILFIGKVGMTVGLYTSLGLWLVKGQYMM